MTDLMPADVMPTLEVVLPTRSVADSVLRAGVYAMRMFDGVGFDGAGTAALHTRDIRTLLTSSVAGSVKSAQGFAAASSGTERLQHASMLAYHPLELLRWASRLFARCGGSTTGSLSLAATARTLASSLWVLWIICTMVVSVRQLRSCSATSAYERRTLTYRLAKLVLDTPIALHFLCGASLLPLALVGALGCASSLLGLRAALRDADPAQRPRFRCSMPLLAVGSHSSVRRAWGTPQLSCAAGDDHQLLCTPVRRRSIGGCGGGQPGSPFRRGARRRLISSGPLSRSSQW